MRVTPKAVAREVVPLLGIAAVLTYAFAGWEALVILLVCLGGIVGLTVGVLVLLDRWRGATTATPVDHVPAAEHPLAFASALSQAAPTEPSRAGQANYSGLDTLGGCLVLLFLLFVGGCFLYRNVIYDGPIPEVLDVVLNNRPGFDFAYVANVKVKNSGRAGKIRVIVDLKYGNFWTKHKVVEMAAGETQVVPIVFSEPTFLEGGLQAECEARAKPEWYFDGDQNK